MSQTYVPAALKRLVRDRASDYCEYRLMPESMTFAPLDTVYHDHTGQPRAVVENGRAIAGLF